MAVRLLLVTTFGSALLCGGSWFSLTGPPRRAHAAQAVAATQSEQRTEITQLEFRDFFAADTQELKPSTKLLGLQGKRVRMIGFMAQMEQPPPGVFYLCARPVYADESGGGTADLPPAHVRVIVRSAREQAVAFVRRPIEVTGILEVGNQAEPDGTVSAVRLVLDPPERARKNSPHRRAPQTRFPQRCQHHHTKKPGD